MNFITYSKHLPFGRKLVYLFSVALNRMINKSRTFVSEEQNRLIIQLAEAIGFKFAQEGEKIHFKKDQLTVTARKESSDLQVFRQIFIDQEYFNVVELFKRNQWPLNYLIDAGANVGYTSLYFLHHLPKCKVLALEPFGANFELCKQNLAPFPSATVINQGLWGSDSDLYLQSDFRDNQDWSMQYQSTKVAGANCIQASSMPTILNLNPDTLPDFIKIDIEGGEFDVFNDKNDLSWLDQIKVLAIEIHDECGDRNVINAILSQHHFFHYRVGELTVAINQTLLLEK